MFKTYLFFIIQFLIFTTLVFSQNALDLQKMRVEYENLKSLNSPTQGENENENLNDFNSVEPMRVSISPYLIELARLDSVNQKINYFGYDFFTKRDSIAFWENLPTPPVYLLGPGDELVISIWGETQLRRKYTISREGSIYDEKVGLLTISGKTLNDANKYLLRQFGRVYATLNGTKPSSYIDISLGNLKSINVNFVGELKYPGVYPIHPFSNVITGLIQAGGVDTSGSLRKIIIKRKGLPDRTIDLYDYFLNGNLSNEVQLRNQDIIVIPPRLSTIYIDSAVFRPGVYESKLNETAQDMIEYAGGLNSISSGEIVINRPPFYNKLLKMKTNGESFYFNISDASSKIVFNGDIINALKIYKSSNNIEVIGRVKNPGKYHFSKGMTVLKALRVSGGVNDSLFSKNINMDYAKIIRRDPTSTFDKVILFNISDILNNLEKDIKLENFDKVVVYPNKNYVDRKVVKISGEVAEPGHYSLIINNESLESIIERAGGYTKKALKNGISIYRAKEYIEPPPPDKFFPSDSNPDNSVRRNFETNKNEELKKIRLAWHDLSLSLMPGDSIIVKEDIGAIYVYGEVYNPGLVAYKKGKSAKYYINAAGGINNYGNKKNAVVIKPNGISSPLKRVDYRNIESGSTIIIYRGLEESNQIRFADLANSATSIITSLVTLILITRQTQ